MGLSTSAHASTPPQNLLPFLTPILRQRVHLLSSNESSTKKSWLLLLNWNANLASKLPQLAEQMYVEPHPVSGEVEIDDSVEIEYRRLDSQTLHARMKLEEFELLPIFLWCMADDDSGSGWKLTELRPLEDMHDGAAWFDNIEEATANPATAARPTNGANGHSSMESEEEVDDGAYWASYDMTPGRTPVKRSPAPPAARSVTSDRLNTNEVEYFDRYNVEVQPAMDPYDPEEDAGNGAESTLTHHESEFQNDAGTISIGDKVAVDLEETNRPSLNGFTDGGETVEQIEDSAPERLIHPRPASVGSASSIENLERQAAATEQDSSQAENGIKMHISTDIKSLYRLAKSAGIPRQEFERLVKTELRMLDFMDME
jgi:hypothetical protein